MDRVKGAARGAVNGVKSIQWSDVKRNTILMAWLISGLVVFLAPLIQWKVRKNQYYKAAGQYIEYEQQQEEQDQNQDDDYTSDYAAYYKECGWWNIACQRKQMKYANYYMGDNNNDQDQDENGNNNYQFTIPAWFVIISGGDSEELRRWKEENTGVRQDDLDETAPTGGEITVVVFMFLTFLVVLGLGFVTFYKRAGLAPIKWSLVFMIQMCFMNFLLLPSLISNEDRMWDESIYGWYGQIGVLMAFFDFYVLIFSIVFLIVLYLEDRKQQRNTVQNDPDGVDRRYNPMMA